MPWAPALLHPGGRGCEGEGGIGVWQWPEGLFTPGPSPGVQSLLLELCPSCLEAGMAHVSIFCLRLSGFSFISSK